MNKHMTTHESNGNRVHHSCTLLLFRICVENEYCKGAFNRDRPRPFINRDDEPYIFFLFV